MDFDKHSKRTIDSPSIRAVPTGPHAVFARQCEEISGDGTRLWGLAVDAVLPTDFGETEFMVFARFQDAVTGDWACIGRCHALPVFCSHPMLEYSGETIEVTLVRVGIAGSLGPEGSLSTTIALVRDGHPPGDVTNFTATPVGSGVSFEWDALTGRPDVIGYEIRAGVAGWAAAAVVVAAGPVQRPVVWVARNVAPGLNFYIKAVTGSEDYSDAEDTATLTSAEGACLDARSSLGYQEVTVPAGATSVSVTTVCPYAAAPYVVGGPSGDTPFKPSFGTWSQNGDDTWSATMYIPFTAPTGDVLTILHEGGA